MTGHKKKSRSMTTFVVIALVVAIAITLVTKSKVTGTESPQPQQSVTQSSPDLNTTPLASSPAVNEQPTPPSAEAAAVTATESTDDIASLAEPRVLGNPDAPVKIVEHSSFTCGHCAQFHKTNFKNLKTDYIDTGKAYIVFDDFPRNQIDIMIGALARCISKDSYFNFIQLLFETQGEWAGGDFKEHVKQNAVIAGLSPERAEECMNNQKLQESLAANRQTAQDKFNINSTPNLVLNDQKVVPGMSPYEEIKKAIDDELAKQDK